MAEDGKGSKSWLYILIIAVAIVLFLIFTGKASQLAGFFSIFADIRAIIAQGKLLQFLGAAALSALLFYYLYQRTLKGDLQKGGLGTSDTEANFMDKATKWVIIIFSIPFSIDLTLRYDDPIDVIWWIAYVAYIITAGKPKNDEWNDPKDLVKKGSYAYTYFIVSIFIAPFNSLVAGGNIFTALFTHGAIAAGLWYLPYMLRKKDDKKEKEKKEKKEKEDREKIEDYNETQRIRNEAETIRRTEFYQQDPRLQLTQYVILIRLYETEAAIARAKGKTDRADRLQEQANIYREAADLLRRGVSGEEPAG